MSSGLRQVPRSSFDKGHDTAIRTATIQVNFLIDNWNTFKEFDKKSKKPGWKTERCKELAEKLRRKERLELKEYNFIDEWYEAVTSIVYGIEGYKKEFYKQRPRNNKQR
jgi:hypothetical protein